MRVIHVITRLIIGGAQENTLSSVLGLQRAGTWEARLISGPSLGPEGSLEARAKVIPDLFQCLPSLVRPIHPWKDILAYVQLARRFRQLSPAIVHTHSGKAGLLGRMAARRAGVPVIIHTIHGPSFGPFQGRVANVCFRYAERQAGRITDHFVTVAHAMTRLYLEAGIGRPSQYTRILSGFDLKPYQEVRDSETLRRRWSLGANALVISKIARLFKLKGHDDLIEVAPMLVRQYPEVRFLLIGDGLWRSRLEQQIARLDLKRHFIFTGLVTPDEIPGLLGITDILVHLSRREGLPRALAQALAAGRPVVAYDSDGAGEVCIDGQTGFLVAKGDRQLLAQRMLELLASAELRLRLGQQGQRLVQQDFSMEKMIDSLDSLYRRMLNMKGVGMATI